MSKSSVPIAAPKTLRYEQDAGLPVAIEARSNRRTFYPSNGNTFGPSTTNVLRMTLNSRSFVDFSHSYLQMKFTNLSGRALALDEGIPFFNRLQIMSGGVELEDIQEWSRLYAILNSIQASNLNSNEKTLTLHDKSLTSIVGDNAATLHNTANSDVHGSESMASGTSKTFNFPLMSGIFNIDKYFPLLLTDQGLDLYFYLNPTPDLGCYATGGLAADGYSITEVKYVAHEVNLDESFVNQMKQSMSATGGLLSMSSTTYRYYQSNLTSEIASASVPISCRVKSLKALLVRPQRQDLTGNQTAFPISTGQAMGITSVQFRVGSVLYPQSAITFDQSNPGEMFNEVRKAFGTLGSYTHGTLLNGNNYKLKTGTGAADGVVKLPGNSDDIITKDQQKSKFVIAYDFETFAKSATESGLNVGDRALPISMEINRIGHIYLEGAGTGAGARGDLSGADYAPLQSTSVPARLDIFAMCDCIIYIDLMGRITTRI